LQWAGKAEHTSFEIDTVSLHVHERIDSKTIIDSVKKEDEGPWQQSLFETMRRPLREEIEFYKHRDGWGVQWTRIRWWLITALPELSKNCNPMNLPMVAGFMSIIIINTLFSLFLTGKFKMFDFYKKTL